MATIIDAAAIAKEHIDECAPVQDRILPPERQCDYCGEWMRLVERTCPHMVRRTHLCTNDGYMRVYGGSLRNG